MNIWRRWRSGNGAEERQAPAARQDVDPAGLGRLDMLKAERPLTGWRVPAWIVAVLIASMAVWAYFAELDEVAIAPGEVIPQGNVKMIQHLEGGIIRDILVAEGDVVEPGDPLVLLSLGAGGLNADELQVQLDALALKRARLEAQSSGGKPSFPEEIAARRPDLVRSERDAFDSRLRELESSAKILREQVLQQELAVQELDTKRRALEADRKLARQSLRMSQDLLSRGLMAKLEHLERQRELTRLDGVLATIEASLPREAAALEEARERLQEAKLRFQRESYEELGEVELAVARNKELLDRATDQVLRTQIRSPIGGVVKNLRYHTIGGVVGPGEPIMEIVPSGENLVIEAKLNPVDRGYVRVGQRAVVKISTYEFIRYGGLDGAVSQIAADSNTSPAGAPYFRVIVTTDRSYLGDEQNKLPITPGMQASVDIHTGARSVLSYLARPVLKLKHEAFRER